MWSYTFDNEPTKRVGHVMSAAAIGLTLMLLFVLA
jgi:hypothetical protein